MIGEFLIPIGLIFALLLIYEYKPEHNKLVNENIDKTENENNINNINEKPVEIKEKENKEEIQNSKGKENGEEIKNKEEKNNKEKNGETNENYKTKINTSNKNF